ncbi:MAG: hypothetical protein LBT47_07390 [Deltaproteobacteria bacterium]|jgi:hypothetical protein|nr:hypothetical protein [Deltaproteobacteria bacterium]
MGDTKSMAETFGHVYLFEPGLWTMDGLYFDEGGVRHRQTGELVTVHTPDLWTIESRINISGQDTRDFSTRYEIEPFASGATHTQWKSETGGPESIFGLFVVVEDCLMMPWQSLSGVHWGQEVLTRSGVGEYLSRGFAFLKDRKVSAWAVKLIRQG